MCVYDCAQNVLHSVRCPFVSCFERAKWQHALSCVFWLFSCKVGSAKKRLPTYHGWNVEPFPRIGALDRESVSSPIRKPQNRVQ